MSETDPRTDAPRVAPAAADDGLALAREAAAGGVVKRGYVRGVFSDIAPRYDLLNHLLSANVDRRWRRLAIAQLDWPRRPDGRFLDLCAGTLDVAVQLAGTAGFRGRVIAADFAEPMLRAGSTKRAGRPVSPVVADALQLPLPTGSMAGAIVAFGARNLADLDAGLREVHRVLEPGARFVVLEFSTPANAVVRAAYLAYFRHVLPLVGRLVSGHRSAYAYLPESVAHFPTGDALAARLRSAGFATVAWRPVTFGIAAIHTAVKGGAAQSP
ncbi:MAG TPA: ubiquinone/menaquinone biosynthesis methyltransferase [Gemmatimonadaceae bacterium]|nr:ubiquinone/menaquinone biosynthesis methyltransferase [Gemmatimonadaceae bacterium]